jgi:histidinol phosphatase-like enzyme (inositol monophosphatase family)
MTPELDLQAALEFAKECAWQAGRLTLGYFQTGITVERKADHSPVTAADQQAEQKIRQMIGEQWPDHNIIGEEYANKTGDSPYTWIVDPIDGTKSFVHGVPFYANLLALVDADGPLIGIANYPALNEMVFAARGMGCYWNGRRCRVSAVDRLEEAAVMTSEIEAFKTPPTPRSKIWQQLMDATYLQRTWGDAYGYALVATGRAEVMFEPALKIWDAAPFLVIMEEAGVYGLGRPAQN